MTGREESAGHLDHTELGQAAKVLVFILRKLRKGESPKDFKHRTEIFKNITVASLWSLSFGG